MDDEMSTNDVFPLLELPAGVETLLLPFVASRTGGLQTLLNLRQVCRTTKSWVDNLPPRQGKSLFSKAQVRMDAQVDTLERFVESPPPSAVSALSVNIKAVLPKNPRAVEEEVWAQFCAAWAPRLETLELRNLPAVYDGRVIDIFNNNRRVLRLVESPNIQTIRLASILVPWNIFTVFPSSFDKVSELSVQFVNQFRFEADGELKRFYSELKKNGNLRKLETFIYYDVEYECIRKFIDPNREDEQFQLTLHLKDPFPRGEWNDDVEEEDGFRSKCFKFAESVAASKSTIRLVISEYFNLENAVSFLPRHVASEMFKKVEVVEMWRPSEDTLSLLERLPRLKRVKVKTVRDGDPVMRRLDELTFPPSLEELSFTAGFPAIRNLPVALKSLTLLNLSCSVAEFVNSLTLLKTQCAGLETLNVTWTCETTKKAAVDFEEIETSPGFANLRSLTLKCDLFKKDVGNFRALLLRGFQVETLRLHHLALRFRWKGQKDRSLPVLDAQFFTRLCAGPVGNSLLMVDVQKESATPDGLPWLEKLTSLAAGNAKSREEREGRGRWQRQWKFIEKLESPPESDSDSE